ncbi:hypothetical protein [Streptomyces turgidiscabies]|uniref:hypothetical protein n=1 Tax=Streptomyces turgidiscabies TaxID=85558 RepID=UPI0038F625F3
MRSLLALILSWLMPSTGKRRSTPPAPTEHHPLTDEPTQTLGVVRPARRSPRPPEFLRGEDTPLIRPYLIAHEQTHGIYFHGATA